VLFSTVRTYLKNIALVPEIFDGQIASTGFSVLRAKTVTTGKYLFYYSLTDDFINRLSNIQRGTSYPAVRDSDVREQPIPLPPLPEQERIVARIEELFTQLEAGVAGLKRVQAALKRYKASVLEAAVGGRLLASGEVESSEDGLQEGWKWISLKSLSKEIYRYPTFYGMEHLIEGVPVMRGEHINSDGSISHDWKDYWYVSPHISNKFPKTVVESGDLIMSVRGSVGKLGVVDDLLSGAQMSPNCIRISIRRDLGIPKFLYFFLKSTSGQNAILENVNATTIQTIKASSITEINIPLPPLDEQQRIVAEVERRLSVAAQAETTVEAGLKRAERLRQAILKLAFEGKLVEQNDNDEPASMLLKRVEQERKLEKKEEKQSRRISRQRNKSNHTQIIKVESAKDLHKLLLIFPGKRVETDQLWKESNLNILKNGITIVGVTVLRPIFWTQKWRSKLNNLG